MLLTCCLLSAVLALHRSCFVGFSETRLLALLCLHTQNLGSVSVDGCLATASKPGLCLFGLSHTDTTSCNCSSSL